MKKKTTGKAILSLAGAILLAAVPCGTAEMAAGVGSGAAAQELTSDSKGATEFTKQKNEAVRSLLDFNDRQEAEFATRGRIASPEKLEIKDADGNIVWSQKAYDFLEGTAESPDTANPSLWENAKNNHAYGLFEVEKGIYQVRGYDMANLTLVEGDTGWIVLDTTMCIECADAAFDLVKQHLGEKPIKAVIISHPHVDHFGGVGAFVNNKTVADASLPIKKQLAGDKIPLIVPEGFTAHAVEENLYAGNAMGRRANYQYGTLIDKSPTGALSIGIGMGQSKGTVSFVVPSYEVKKTGERITIDGVEMEFQLTPGTEAPAEMNIYFPRYKALWAAENCTATLHNLYTLRGAEVRDGNAWAKYIMEAISRYADQSEVVFQSHNWPHWGKGVIRDYMLNTAAVYKYINDQSLTYINQGYNGVEIENMMQLPNRLSKNWYTRPYYGTPAHNAMAVYQKYMGYYDANPVNLCRLPAEQSAKKMAQYLELGSMDACLAQAKRDFAKGEYQWVAEFTNQLVFADPSNREARLLCADALEQLGYQAESGTWRNCYLTGALELRKGNMAKPPRGGDKFGSALMSQLTPEMAFDYMDILLDKKAMADRDAEILFHLEDLGKYYRVYLVDGVLLHAEDAGKEPADTTVECTSKTMLLLFMDYDAFARKARIAGDAALLQRLAANLTEIDRKSGMFNIVEP
ncbi:alkyl/aryl-sulfatase [Selenomonas sp. TAMA-11512]|uniref:alkyl/aryl-sulfatase n=1 Tax=Selenomonas sp. TAMA-11512 TaxID=3095337 RepID=UPI0030866123|nr:alkyl/aryl-sulfatase [Selenomonas sp. TAMA-11512]